MSEDNRDQHVVPRFYQNFFAATAEKQLFVRPKGGETIDRPLSTRSQAVEDDAYTIINDGARDTSCDEVNKRVENWVAPRIASLDVAGTPSKEQWTAIWALTANLLARSRHMRDTLKESIEWAAQVAEELAPVLEEPTIDQSPVGALFGMKSMKLAEVLADLKRASDVAYPLMAARGTEPFLEELKGVTLNLLIAPEDARFITSDDPALVYLDGKPAEFVMKEGFLKNPGVEVFLPLAPRMACLWSFQNKQELAVRPVTTEEVQLRNLDTRQSCYKCVFGSRRDELDVLP